MAHDNTSLITPLSAAPVLGVAMDNVSVLRLDRLGGAAPGNKWFKLRALRALLESAPARRVLSFGGAWSNHLHALAAWGAAEGVETVGFVRGGERETPALADMRRWGMQVVALARSDYRRRHDPVFQQALLDVHGPGLLLPEGGAAAPAVRGCMAIADLATASGITWHRVVVAVGTGTTLAGLAAGLAPPSEVVGVSALRGADDLPARITGSLAQAGLRASVPWQLLDSYHCGGFARVSPQLQALMGTFEAVHGIALEPVYTGKALLAVHDRLRSGLWRHDERILLVHTGGLQGRRGYDWLAESGPDQALRA